uniref:Uncharacterized protein n=1 Tax=Dromaius novaehollandiae TaxID=8790 RepID=A0A8C4P2J8_DRONO
IPSLSDLSRSVSQIQNLDTRKNATEQKEPQYKPYDNAYFFILFVMLFYSFLALTVFFGYVRSKKAISKKDPYQEFIEDRNRNKKWNLTRPGRSAHSSCLAVSLTISQSIA